MTFDSVFEYAMPFAGDVCFGSAIDEESAPAYDSISVDGNVGISGTGNTMNVTASTLGGVAFNQIYFPSVTDTGAGTASQRLSGERHRRIRRPPPLA